MTNQNDDLAHEIWAAAQTPPGDSIEGAVARINALLSKLRAPVADERKDYCPEKREPALAAKGYRPIPLYAAPQASEEK